MAESTIGLGADEMAHPEGVFVVVCGMPRSGTRQFTDFLNRHADIAIQGEMRHALIRSVRDLMVAADAAYPAGYSAKFYQKKRARTVTELFASLSKNRRVSKPKATIHGFKTPQGEHYHRLLKDIVGKSFTQTSYFYCIRNIVDCYLSLVEMPWFVDGPNRYISNYINSLGNAVIVHRLAAAGESKVSIGILNLDDFIRSEAKVEWVASRLFAALPVKLAPGWIDDIVGSTTNRNATERATGKRRAKHLDGAAAEVFQRRLPEIEAAVAQFNATFSENLSCKLPLVELVA
jgi:hypothetical protein